MVLFVFLVPSLTPPSPSPKPQNSDHFPLPDDGERDTQIEQFRIQFKRIMCVLARFNADILQAVGIADAVGLLLSYVSEEETFWIVHKMLER